MVLFKLPDAVTLRDQAYKAAIEDARDKAQKLADLAGVKLGRVTSIQEDRSGGDSKTATSGTTGDVVKRLNLTVQFEIVK